VPLHVNHSAIIEEVRGTSVLGAGQRPNELICGGDVGLPPLVVLVTAHHDAVWCSRAIVWAVIYFAEFTRWH